MLLRSLINFNWLEFVYFIELFKIFETIFDFVFAITAKKKESTAY